MSIGPPAPKSAQSPENKAKAPLPPEAELGSPIASANLSKDPFSSAEGASEAPERPSADLSVNDIISMEDGITFEADEQEIYGYTSASSLSELDSLFNSSSGLGWNDLFDSTMAFSLPTMLDPAYDDSLNILAHVASQPYIETTETQFYARPFTSNIPPNLQEVGSLAADLDIQPPPYSVTEISENELLEAGKVLLKHFREFVIPQFAPLPMNSKSPWEVLNWAAAIHTHANMTFLQNPDVKNASKANLLAILGCSAHTIAKTQHYPDTMSHDKAMQILEYASRKAKFHLQESLRTETSGAGKAKYKEQLMAVYSLIALSTLIGNANDARCYLIDAERLVRIRGLAKRELSRKVRFSHHVYTWLRIIGESTFTLQDHNSSGLQAKIEKIFKNHFETSHPMSLTEQENQNGEDIFQLDDFLRIEAHGADSDSDANSWKEQEAGLRDIHLADPRKWSKTLYMDIYGIPELWLSLVSQTTRVANILELVERTSLQVPRGFADSLQRKTNRLEHMVCTFSAQHSIPSSSASPRAGDNQTEATVSNTASAGQAMLRAMGSALVIFFYRRIRKVHPWILQSHVSDVIAALKDFDQRQDATSIKTPGTPWPAFIAGCEAMSTSSRSWFLAWMQKGASQSAFNGFTFSQKVMQEVWEQQDTSKRLSEKTREQNTGNRKGQTCSWVDILREGKFWLMLY